MSTVLSDNPLTYSSDASKRNEIFLSYLARVPMPSRYLYSAVTSDTLKYVKTLWAGIKDVPERESATANFAERDPSEQYNISVSSVEYAGKTLIPKHSWDKMPDEIKSRLIDMWARAYGRTI